MTRPLLALIAVALQLLAQPCAAFESSISGFGTLGYARSDRPYAYQRFINDSGTFKRDSVFGLQLDGKLSDAFSFTVQGKLAASPSSDTKVEANLPWVFVSYRPSNDLLFRAGKLRVPFYLHSETTDVGATFDLARLPVEVYSQSPTVDFKGLSFSRTWNFGTSDAVLDGYWGRARTNVRLWFRDDQSPFQPLGAEFLPITVEARGLAFTVHRNEDSFRIGYTHAIVRSRSEHLFNKTYPFVQVPDAPGVGYYQTYNDVPGPGFAIFPRIVVPVITLGADVTTRFGIRFVGEYGRRINRDIDLGYDSAGGYLAAFRRSGKWTPYLSYALLRSTSRNREFYAKVNGTVVPSLIPDAELINALQRAGADTIPTFDQSAVAIGTSYSISPTSRFKAEIQQVRIGEVSALVDALPGTDVRHQTVRILSLSYSFVF